MNFFERMITKCYKRHPNEGEVWLFDKCNPFEKEGIFIKQIKNGYVKYQFIHKIQDRYVCSSEYKTNKLIVILFVYEFGYKSLHELNIG